MAYKKKVKKHKRQIGFAVAHVSSTFNNTITTITTPTGDVLFTTSSGRIQKGSRKGTPYIATQSIELIVKDMKEAGITELDVRIRGLGPGKESVIRALQAAGFDIKYLKDVTPLAHNGPRPPKKRRV
ncbi:MAG: 30S ribosomal protein S11 [Candidatus Babeliales bacterium]